MTTAEAIPAELLDLEELSTPIELLDIVLRIPMPAAPTDEELEHINKENPGWKIELGPNDELEVRMIAGGDSSPITGELFAQVRNWRVAGGDGRAWESDGAFKVYHPDIGRRTRSPDVSWISPELLASLSREQRPKIGFWSVCPTFVIEVRSPRDSLPAQQQRMEEWLLFGAELGWLVDPLLQEVWIYRPGAEPERLPRPATLSGEGVLEGLVVDLAEVWAIVDDATDDDGRQAGSPA